MVILEVVMQLLDDEYKRYAHLFNKGISFSGPTSVQLRQYIAFSFPSAFS